MSGTERETEISGNGWHECASWLIRCGALRADHKANWPKATAADLAFILRDGVLLCNLLNTIEPCCIDSKDVNQKPQMAQFLCLRNINAFLSACTNSFELSESDLFEPPMLFDLTNFHKVLCTLSILSYSTPFKNKSIEGFTIKRGRSQEDIYKDLQSTGIGEESPNRSRWRRKREDSGEEEEQEEEANGDDYTEDFVPLAVQPEVAEIYHDLCSYTFTHSLPDSQGAAAAAAASESEKRDYVIKELVETERNYTEVLKSLLHEFSIPLANIMRAEDWSRIFFGIKELTEIHTHFLTHLRKAHGNANALSQVFVDCREKFLIYGDYCANLTTAQTTLNEVCANNDKVNEQVMICQQNANNGKFKLRDILSVPMQRVLKYHLLLDKLVEETPRDWTEDRHHLMTAREVMVDVAQYINEVKRDTDTLDIIKDIQRSIVDYDCSEDIQLKNYGRLLKDGDLKVKAHGDQRVKARYVFIFEQVVLICKAGRGDQYCFREILRLDEYHLEDSVSKKPTKSDTRWSYQWFLVHNKGDKAYTLYARTEDLKVLWMKALQSATDNIYPAACRTSSHKYKFTTFEKPETCCVCAKFLKGRIFQGYNCEICRSIVHKECISFVERCNPAPPPPPPPPPPSLQPIERELSTKFWYVGEMSREAASTKLLPRENGTYLVRIRQQLGPQRKRQDNETSYALSLKAAGSVKHMKIFRRQLEGADLYYLSDSRYFKSIIVLIEYYERHSLSENYEGLDQRLLWPFRRIIAKALYNYQTEEHNQLSLRKGCRVVVLSKEGDDKGWWKGKIGDQVGFFPKVYVEEE